MNTIFDNVSNLYKQFDKFFDVSDKSYHLLVDLNTNKKYDMGLGITKKEILYLQKYSEFFKNPNIFIVGNAFGFSTFVFNYIFKNSKIDVIDSEIEGVDVKIGSDITQKIIKKNNFNINLYIGSSPEDTKKCLRFDDYDIIFIDGLHTNQQLELDFYGIKDYLNKKKYICLCHDVAYAKMESGFNEIISKNKDIIDYSKILDTNISESGIGIFTKGIEIINE